MYRAELKNGNLCIVTKQWLIRWGPDGPFARLSLNKFRDAWNYKHHSATNHYPEEYGTYVKVVDEDNWPVSRDFNEMEFETSEQARELVRDFEKE